MGTAQVTSLPEVDFFAPLTPFAGTVIGMGRVKPRAAAVNGQAVEQLSVHLTCTLDHRIWEGRNASRFLTEVQKILTEGELADELGIEGQV